MNYQVVQDKFNDEAFFKRNFFSFDGRIDLTRNPVQRTIRNQERTRETQCGYFQDIPQTSGLVPGWSCIRDEPNKRQYKKEPRSQEATEVHQHADGIKHDHHNQPAKHEHENNKSEKKEKKGCCNDEVQKLQSLDKALNQNAKTVIDVPAFAAIISTFFGIDIFSFAKAYPLKYIARYFYPPPPDIRIAIQSFQI